MSRPPAPRVAILVHAVFPGDPRVRRQADALLDAGYEVDVFCLRRPGEPIETREGGVRVRRLPIDRTFIGFSGHIAEYLAFTLVAAWRLAVEHRRRGYAVIQVATPPDFLVFAALPERWQGVPIILDLHEDMPAFFRDRFAHPLLRPMRPLVELATRASAAVADELITVHEPLRELAVARGIAPQRIGVVMNSADPRLFDPERHPRRPFMADGRLRLVHHSNFQRIYGLDAAIEGLARVRPDLDWTLDVYGDGPWRGPIEAAIRRTGLHNRVSLRGRVALEELPGILAGADVGLVPSVAEPYLQLSLSTKLLEYAAMGVPTIATDLATFRHHFSDAALRFVPGGDPDALAEAVEGVAADPDGTVAMGAEARRQAAAYAWDLQKVPYVELVDRLAGRGDDGGAAQAPTEPALAHRSTIVG